MIRFNIRKTQVKLIYYYYYYYYIIIIIIIIIIIYVIMIVIIHFIAFLVLSLQSLLHWL